jgi:hypothetical protein
MVPRIVHSWTTLLVHDDIDGPKGEGVDDDLILKEDKESLVEIFPIADGSMLERERVSNAFEAHQEGREVVT